jgi:hypothetical protein
MAKAKQIEQAMAKESTADAKMAKVAQEEKATQVSKAAAESEMANAKRIEQVTQTKQTAAESEMSQARKAEHASQEGQSAADAEMTKAKSLEQAAKASRSAADSESTHAEKDDLKAASKLKEAAEFRVYALAKISQAKWFCLLSLLLLTGPLLLCILKKFNANKAVGTKTASVDIESAAPYQAMGA